MRCNQSANLCVALALFLAAGTAAGAQTTKAKEKTKETEETKAAAKAAAKAAVAWEMDDIKATAKAHAKFAVESQMEEIRATAAAAASIASQIDETKFVLATTMAEEGRFELEAALAGGKFPGSQDVKLTEDEELQMYALNGMRNANPEEAVPLLARFLKGEHRMPLKERALSVLASFDTKQARDVVVAVARDASNPELQLKSMRYLGRMDSDASRQALLEIYASTQNKDAKKTILRSLQNGEDVKRLVALAKAEQDPELRAYAGRQLGSMGARSEVRQLYDAEKDAKAKSEMIRALAAAEDVEKLTEIAKKDAEPAIRREAIRRMTAIDSAQTSDVLVALYGSEKELEVRKEVISSLARREDAKNVVLLARKETDPELKKYAVSMLTRMRSKEANDYLLELLNK